MRFLRPKAVLCALAIVAIVATAACGSSSNKSSDKDKKAATSSTLPMVTPATQIIADTVPEGAKRLHFEYGPVPITPGQNNIGYSRRIPQPKEDGYIIGMSTNLHLKDGSIPPVDIIHLHHGVWVNLAAKDATSPGLPERFFAAGEEKTRQLAVEGYGYPYKTSDIWLLNYMLHNTISKRSQVWITYDLDFVPAKSAAAKTVKPARPIWMDVQNGSIYPVFDVIQGTGEDGTYTYPDDAKDPYACNPNLPERARRRCSGEPKNEWTVDSDGVLLGTAGHVHPGGLHDDLWLTRKGATGLDGHIKPGRADTAHLFSSVGTYWEPRGNVSWDVAMSATPDTWRVKVKKGDVMSISSTYDSKTASWYESMGIMVVWMANGDNIGGDDPFTKPVDVQGVLTHGHLAENDNHGGSPAPDQYSDMTKLPDKLMKSGSVLPIADFAYQGDMSVAATVPTVKQGGFLVYRNDDSPQGIPHTITSCEAPCDLSSGIAYPLANGVPRFDSGELAKIGPPSINETEWSTPKDLPPGTYTYFCRIHPFMRGAFRVVAN